MAGTQAPLTALSSRAAPHNTPALCMPRPETLKPQLDTMQATAGTDGQVLLFDTALFQEGTLVSAFAKLQAAPAGSDMMHLAWTSGQHLITDQSQHTCRSVRAPR